MELKVSKNTNKFGVDISGFGKKIKMSSVNQESWCPWLKYYFIILLILLLQDRILLSWVNPWLSS